MDCPKCKIQNPDNAATCSACGAELTNIAQPKKMCSLALWSFILILFTPMLVFLIPYTTHTRNFFEPFKPAIPFLVLAFLFAISALVKIRKSHGRLNGKGFAITSIIIIISLLFGLPILKKIIEKPNLKPHQKNQFRTIGIALEFFNSEWDGYPPSSSLDGNGQPYCGAMKLCEAMLGQDLLGFQPDSVFNRDGVDGAGRQLYDITTQGSRKDFYLTLESANIFRMEDIYGSDVGSFLPLNYVLCDVYIRKVRTGQKVGMPMLYYKADTSKTAHDVNNPDNPDNIYNYKDNHALLALGKPDKPNKKHPLFENPKLFYEMTRNYNITTESKPHNPDSFILLSAGEDGLYGTMDDIANFNFRWKF